MIDKNKTEPERPEPKNYPFWPDSLSERIEAERLKSQKPSLGKFLMAIAKLAGQSFIYWMLFLLLAIFLINPSMWGTDQNYMTVEEIVKLATYTVSVFLAVKIFEESDVVSLGLKKNKKAIKDFLVGLAIPFSFLALRFILFLTTSAITIQDYSWEANPLSYVIENLLITFLIFIFVGWSEELLSRGYHLRILSKGSNRFFGILLSAGLFAYLHRNNEGITTSTLVFIFLFAIMLSFAFFRTGQLWLAMGIHTGWDFFAAVIFGSTPIYGLKIFHIMEIRYFISPISYFIFNIIGLFFMAILIHYYTVRQKPERLGW